MNRTVFNLILAVATTLLIGCGSSAQPNPSAQSVTRGTVPNGAPPGLILSMVKRPIGVPSGFVPTPDGWFHPSCILEVRNGDRLNASAGVVELATGGRQAVAACAYPSYTASGKPRFSSAFHGRSNTITPPEPNGWQVYEDSHPGNIGKLTANWLVPSAPTTHTPETDYYFPGIENAGPTTYIAQPVLAWGYGSPGWTIASWFCCFNGNISHGPVVGVSSLQTINGTVAGTSCNSSTGICATWNVETVSGSASSGFTVVQFNEPMNYEAGGVLESYSVSSCSQYSTDANAQFKNVTAYDVNGSLLSPTWTEKVDRGATCDESATAGSGTSPLINLNWWPANLGRPASPGSCGLITQGQGLASSGLVPGTRIFSCNGSYKLVMQSDGNLVEYQGSSTPIWATNTNGTSAYFLEMQGDGNLVLYDPLTNAKWSTNTGGHPGAHLALQNDGNLAVYSSGGALLWVK